MTGIAVTSVGSSSQVLVPEKDFVTKDNSPFHKEHWVVLDTHTPDAQSPQQQYGCREDLEADTAVMVSATREVWKHFMTTLFVVAFVGQI